MALSSFDYKFNTYTLPPWENWSESYENVENQYTTEAGTDQLTVVRTGKLTVSATFRVDSTWANRFKTFADMGSFTLTSYDHGTGASSTRTVRLRGLKIDHVSGSTNLSGTNGVWEVSFSLIQF